jgi:hypothetical protein
MVFNLTAAVYSHVRAGDAVADTLSPVILLVFVVASWALRPASRKLAAAGTTSVTQTAARDLRLAA